MAAEAPPRRRPAAAERVFIAGGAAGIDAIVTPWPQRRLRWIVHSQAGKVAMGEALTDAKGQLSLRFDVPDVRVAVHLALVIGPVGDAPADPHVVDIVVLPADPFAAVRKTLDKLGIGLLPPGPLAPALARSRLQYKRLQHDIARGSFDGKVVILGGLLGRSRAATRTWLDSLPADTCIIVVNNAEKESPFSLIKYLSKQQAPKQGTFFWEKRSPVWTDLQAQWLTAGKPTHKLAQPLWITSFRLLAGWVAPDDGALYPLAMASRDTGGRPWLIWNPTDLPPKNDPRWDLILRNSLLWAHRLVAPGRQGWQREGPKKPPIKETPEA